MNKLWLVLAHEYGRHVLQRRFLLSLLSLPLVIGLMALLVFIIVRMQTDTHPVGYVDHSGLLANPTFPPPPQSTSDAIELIPFTSEAQAEEALQTNQIQAYYILEADYRQTSRVRLISLKNPASNARQRFESFLRVNLLAGQPPEVIRRIEQGNHLIIRDPGGTRQMGEGDWVNIFIPFFAGFAYMFTIITTSGYLMQAMVEEKENRTMEVLITSVSPMQLITGKVIGIMCVGLTQLLCWVAITVLIVLASRQSIPFLSGLNFSPGLLGLMVLALLPAFVMVSGLMTAVGAAVTEAREGQQLSSLFILPISIPFYFTAAIMTNPNGPLARILSYFPLTAPATLLMRAVFSLVPAWETALIVAIQVVGALGALWLAGRTFRIGMLRYGKRLSWREIFGAAG